MTFDSATRKPIDHVYYSMTKSLCGTCKRAVDAKIIFRDGAVFFDKFCPKHGKQECLVSSSVEWYLDSLSFIAPATPPKRFSKPISERRRARSNAPRPARGE